MIVVAVLVTIVLAEWGARFVAFYVLGKPRMFEEDRLVGWRVKKNLDQIRTNADGIKWRIVTDSNGRRDIDRVDVLKHKELLIAGDSFAFGEGVDIGDRFDKYIQLAFPDIHIVNLGVMGYGTDQELIAVENYKADRHVDVVVILVYFNDVFDVLRREFAGRSKPWFDVSEDGEGLIVHRPEQSLHSWIRDRSAIWLLFRAIFERDTEKFSNVEISRGVRIVELAIKNLATWARQRDTKFILVEHGITNRGGNVAKLFGEGVGRVCHVEGISCLDLDLVLQETGRRDQLFLADGHWSRAGHEIAGREMARFLGGIVGG